MPYKTIQNRFTKGSLNPKLLGRSDIDMYYSSAQQMTNVSVIPFGGFTRRRGFDFVLNVPDEIEQISGSNITAYNGGNPAFLDDTSLDTYFITNNVNTWVGDNIVMYDFGISENVLLLSLNRVSVNSKQATATLVRESFPWMTMGSYVYTSPTVEMTTTTNHDYTTGDIVKVYYDYPISGQPYIRWQSRNYTITVIDADTFSFTEVEWNSLYNTVSNGIKTERIDASIVSVNMTETGQGYDPATPPSVVVNGDGAGALLTANVNASGQISDIAIVNGGQDYTNASAVIDAPYSSLSVDVEVSVDGMSWTLIDTIIVGVASDFNIDLTGSYRYVRLKRTNPAENPYLSLSIGGMSTFRRTGSTSKTKLFSFNVKEGFEYALLVKKNEIIIYKDGILKARVSSSFLLESYIDDLKFSQYANTGIFTHEDMNPLRLFRTDDSTWSLTPIEFDSVPYYYFDDVEKFDTPGYSISLDNAEGTVTVTSSGAVFTDSHLGQFIEGNGGRMKITEVKVQKAIGFSIIPFYTSGTINSGDWKITNNYEKTWSETRGYPKTSVFYQGRLWFGASKFRPQTIWGSKVDSFFSFSPDGGYNNDAIEATLDSGQLNNIVNLYAQKKLFVFTEGGEYSFFQGLGEPITPNNLSILKQSSNGSTKRCSPTDIDGFMFFVDQKRRAVISMGYSEESGGELSSSVSLLNSHLINYPVDFVSETNTETEQSSYLYIPTEDGLMTVSCVLLAQEVMGYTQWKTQGSFKSVCVAGKTLYAIIQRDGVLYLEKANEDTLTDCSYKQDSGFTQIVNGLDRFNGYEVDVIIDGVVKDRMTVLGGTLTLPILPSVSLEIGFPFEVKVVSNPIEIAQMGTGTAKKKRIVEATLKLYETDNVKMNESEANLDTNITDDYTFWGVGYFSENPQYEITQSKTGKITVLAVQMNINYEVSNG